MSDTYDLLVPCNSRYDLMRFRCVGVIECEECNGEGVIGDPDCSDLQCPICKGEGSLVKLKEDPFPGGAA